MWPALIICAVAGIWVGYVAGLVVNPPPSAPVEEEWPEAPANQHWMVTWYPAMMTALMVGVGFVLDWSASLVARAIDLLLPGKCAWCGEAKAAFTLDEDDAPRLCYGCAHDPGHEGTPIPLAVVA